MKTSAVLGTGRLVASVEYNYSVLVTNVPISF